MQPMDQWTQWTEQWNPSLISSVLNAGIVAAVENYYRLDYISTMFASMYTNYNSCDSCGRPTERPTDRPTDLYCTVVTVVC